MRRGLLLHLYTMSIEDISREIAGLEADAARWRAVRDRVGETSSLYVTCCRKVCEINDVVLVWRDFRRARLTKAQLQPLLEWNHKLLLRAAAERVTRIEADYLRTWFGTCETSETVAQRHAAEYVRLEQEQRDREWRAREQRIAREARQREAALEQQRQHQLRRQRLAQAERRLLRDQIGEVAPRINVQGIREAAAVLGETDYSHSAPMGSLAGGDLPPLATWLHFRRFAAWTPFSDMPLWPTTGNVEFFFPKWNERRARRAQGVR